MDSCYSLNDLPWVCGPEFGNHLPVSCTFPSSLHPSPPPPSSRCYPTAPPVRSKARAQTERGGCCRRAERGEVGGEREKKKLFVVTCGCTNSSEVKRSISVRSKVERERVAEETRSACSSPCFSTAGRRHAEEERFP